MIIRLPAPKILLPHFFLSSPQKDRSQLSPNPKQQRYGQNITITLRIFGNENKDEDDGGDDDGGDDNRGDNNRGDDDSRLEETKAPQLIPILQPT